MAYNGLHWNSPTSSNSQTQNQFNAGHGFSSALILSSPDTEDYNQTAARDSIWWVINYAKCRSAANHERVIVRLFQPPNTLPVPARNLVDKWWPFIRWCFSQGVRNFVVLNELDIEYEGTYGRPAMVNYMADLGYWIKNYAAAEGQTIWLGFPGPGITQNWDDPGWSSYWNDYANTINNYYDNLAPHVYGDYQPDPLGYMRNKARDMYNWLWSKFGRVVRFTEYGIRIEYANGDHNLRASWYADFIRFVHDTMPYCYAAHCYLASPSDPASQQGVDGRFELTDSEAGSVASAFGGCH